MNRSDRTALMQALARCRAMSPARAAQLDAKLEDEPWESVARFAASVCQSDSLHLEPWSLPPCHGDSVHHPDRAAKRLLQKMLAAGISRWHPDPMAALEEAKQQQKAET